MSQRISLFTADERRQSLAGFAAAMRRVEECMIKDSCSGRGRMFRFVFAHRFAWLRGKLIDCEGAHSMLDTKRENQREKDLIDTIWFNLNVTCKEASQLVLLVSHQGNACREPKKERMRACTCVCRSFCDYFLSHYLWLRRFWISCWSTSWCSDSISILSFAYYDLG